MRKLFDVKIVFIKFNVNDNICIKSLFDFGFKKYTSHKSSSHPVCFV